MLPQHVLFALFTACAAVPLNINLGAYSPALVVGDGEISLGSTEQASNLIETLATGAANTEQGQREGQQENENQQQQERDVAPLEEGAPAEDNTEKRAPNLVRTVDHLGKRTPVPEASPEPEQIATAVESAMQWIKRDINGFNAALSYAREALKDTPKVELGTGEGGSGVGIVVNAGENVNKESAANGAKPAGEAKVKREDVVEEDSETPKLTLVAITEV